MTDSQPLDIVVFGATGYTGQLICEYLQQQYGSSLNWGMAARNSEKLMALRDRLGMDDQFPLVVADSGDKASIDALAACARVLLNAAGPYQQYGSTVVESCARLGTDYLDLNGEPLWMKDMITACDSMAKGSGARIVFSCGFDSLPSDLGVHFLEQQAVAKFGAPLPRVKCRVKALKGEASGGTIASFTATMASVRSQPELVADLTNPFVLTPGFTGPEQPPGNNVVFDEDLSNWSGPFVMATINTKNVHRSNLLLGHAYGADLVYDEMILLGESKPEEGAGGGDFGLDMSLKPGDGPSREEREAGYYEILYAGSNAQGDRLTVEVVGDQDPGYGSTSKMIAEAAVCLSQLPKGNAGCVTAAAVMGDALRERLQANAGLTFQVV